MDLHNDHIIRDYEERIANIFRTCCSTESHIRCGLEACQRSLADTYSNPQPHSAQQRYEHRARSSSRGRGRYFGVGPGIELPTRMHYFEGVLKHDNVADATPGGGLRRIPVVNFEFLSAGNTLGSEYPTGMSTRELEQHLFDAPPRPRIVHTAHRSSHYDEYSAAGSSEGRSGEGFVCSYNTIVSKQVAVGPQPGPSVDQSLHQGQASLLNGLPGNQAQAVDSANSQQGGPPLAEHGLNGTAEENSHDQAAGSERTPEANERIPEALQDESKSINSDSSDWAIVYTPRSSILGSVFGASANGDSDNADVRDNAHFTDSRGWHYG